MDRVRARENGGAAPEASRELSTELAPRGASVAERLFGGSPPGVLARLVVLSFLVGAAMAWLDITPADVFDRLEALWRWVWSFGFDGLRRGAGYVAIGAVIVVPLWLISRMFGRR